MSNDLDKWIDEQNAKQTPEEKEDIVLKIMKHAISSSEGWKNLAKIITTSDDPVKAKIRCAELLTKMAGEHEVDMPVSDISFEVAKVKLVDLFLQQLDSHIAELEK